MSTDPTIDCPHCGTQIARVMEATVGMVGELQGIAGQSLQEIEGLSLLEMDEEDAQGQLEAN